MTESDTPVSRLRKLSSRILVHGVKSGSLGLADQTIISGANFVFMIVAARELGPAGFGLFSILYLVLGLLEALQEALITTPHTVISAGKSGMEYREYTGSVAIMQTGSAVATAGLTVLASIVVYVSGVAIWSALLALALAVVFVLTQTFTRRVLYTETRVGAAVVQDLVVHGLRLLLLGALALMFELTASRMFIVVALAYFFGSLVGLWQIRGSLAYAFHRRVIRQHWKFGNWLGASEIANMVPHYAAAALLSSTLSVSAYGAYRAALQLVHGANVPLRAADSLMRPRLARDAQEGPDAVVRTIRPIILLGGIVLLLFAAFLITLRQPLIGLIYGSEYAPYASVLILLAVKPVVDLLKDLLTNVLLAYRQTRSVFMRTMVGSVSGMLIGGIAVLAFGLPAAGAITLVGAIASVLWLVWATRRILTRREDAPAHRTLPVSAWAADEPAR